MTKIIQYGFGLDYLKHWSIQHALREIFQNFLDYGEYSLRTKEEASTGNIIVKISNNYVPADLEFLRIGNSAKANDKTTIGQYGEGLKMAFLIFKREGLKIRLMTQTHIFNPTTYTNELGECFGIEYYKHNNNLIIDFSIIFTIPQNYYDTFIKTIITPKDVIMTSEKYGRIVQKNKGDIFVGGLFVCSNKNFSKAYDFNSEHIKLDRDRAMPSSFEIKWVSARLNEDCDSWKASDIQYDDMEYISNINTVVLKDFTPRVVANTIQFTTPIINEQGKKEEIVVRHSLKELLLNNSFFTNAIESLKQFIYQKLGIVDMLKHFKEQYPMYGEMSKDFDRIINYAQTKD